MAASFASTPPAAPAPGGPNEASPLNNATNETVLVLSAHARIGRYVSMMTACLFLLGFHVSLISIGYINAGLPCERPLVAFLVASGIVGVCSTVLYLVLETRRVRDEALLLPTEAPPPPSSTHKMLVVLALVSTLVIVLLGALGYASAPKCALTNPIVYNWTLAALLLYACFGALVLLVPLLSAVFPYLAIALLPAIAALVAFANWIAEAGKRGAYGAGSAMQRWLTRGSSSVEQPSSSLPHPSSTFAMYVNCAAVLWLFGYMLLEVHRSWRSPCDAPLHTFVLGVAALGVAIALCDFIADVFKDPMPPLTKVEQTAARDDRKRKLQLYAYLSAFVLVWGALGLVWLHDSETCAHTAPSVYRLALLLGLVYTILVGLLALVLVALALDFCMSGKLRMVVILEQ